MKMNHNWGWDLNIIKKKDRDIVDIWNRLKTKREIKYGLSMEKEIRLLMMASITKVCGMKEQCRDKVKLYMQMKMCIKVNLNLISAMASVNTLKKVVSITKVTGWKTDLMEKVNNYIWTVHYMWEISKMDKKMVQENIPTEILRFTMETGKKTSPTAKVSKL